MRAKVCHENWKVSAGELSLGSRQRCFRATLAVRIRAPRGRVRNLFTSDKSRLDLGCAPRLSNTRSRHPPAALPGPVATLVSLDVGSTAPLRSRAAASPEIQYLAAYAVSPRSDRLALCESRQAGPRWTVHAQPALFQLTPGLARSMPSPVSYVCSSRVPRHSATLDSNSSTLRAGLRTASASVPKRARLGQRLLLHFNATS